MLQTSCEPISLGMGFDLFDLLLTSGASGTSKGMPCALQAPLYEKVYSAWGMLLANLARPPGVKNFFYCLFFGLSLFKLG